MGRGLIDTHFGNCHFLGGEGGGEGDVDWGSIDTHFVGGEAGEGGRSTQLGKDVHRLWKDQFWQC